MKVLNTREIALGFWIAGGFAVFAVVMAVGRRILSQAASAV